MKRQARSRFTGQELEYFRHPIFILTEWHPFNISGITQYFFKNTHPLGRGGDVLHEFILKFMMLQNNGSKIGSDGWLWATTIAIKAIKKNG